MSQKTYHVSRFTFLFRYFIVTALVAIGILAIYAGMSYAIYLSAFGLATLALIVFELRIRSNRIRLADNVVIIESGVLSKNSTRISYGNISDIRINQTAMQRMFGYGDIDMGVPGSFLQQNFSGKGDVNIDTAGMHPGVTLKKFQNVRMIEKTVLKKISEQRSTKPMA